MGNPFWKTVGNTIMLYMSVPVKFHERKTKIYGNTRLIEQRRKNIPSAQDAAAQVVAY